MKTHKLSNEPVPDDAITAAAAAKIAHVCRPCIWRWVLKGKIPGWMVGDRLKVSLADVIAQIRPVKPTNGRASPEPVRATKLRRAETIRTLKKEGLWID